MLIPFTVAFALCNCCAGNHLCALHMLCCALDPSAAHCGWNCGYSICSHVSLKPSRAQLASGNLQHAPKALLIAATGDCSFSCQEHCAAAAAAAGCLGPENAHTRQQNSCSCSSRALFLCPGCSLQLLLLSADASGHAHGLTSPL